jgi:hypothetical protein
VKRQLGNGSEGKHKAEGFAEMGSKVGRTWNFKQVIQKEFREGIISAAQKA